MGILFALLFYDYTLFGSVIIHIGDKHYNKIFFFIIFTSKFRLYLLPYTGCTIEEVQIKEIPKSVSRQPTKFNLMRKLALIHKK